MSVNTDVLGGPQKSVLTKFYCTLWQKHKAVNNLAKVDLWIPSPTPTCLATMQLVIVSSNNYWLQMCALQGESCINIAVEMLLIVLVRSTELLCSWLLLIESWFVLL